MKITRTTFGVILLSAAISAGYAGSWAVWNARAVYMESRISELSRANHELSRENAHIKYVNGLAVEFSMNPLIVNLVDHYAKTYLSQNGPEWKLLQTPEFLTYIMLSLIHAESGGNPVAVGDGGKARGLTQIWLSTARDYGEVTAEQLLDPETNISYAFKHFHHLLKKYNGNLALALYSWNRGEGTVDRLLLYGESPQNGYGKKVYEATLLSNRKIIFSPTGE